MKTVGLDGSAFRTLNDGQGLRFQAPTSWSSDGKHLLVVLVAPDQRMIIALMAIEDGATKPVKSLVPRSISPSGINALLSPDGRNIVYNYPPSPDSPTCDIFLLSVDGSSQVPIIEHPADDTVLGWSPDGRKIVFMSDRSGSMGIWAIEIAGGKPQGEPQLLRPDVGNISAMGITQDGSIFYGLSSGWSDIFIAAMDPETGQITSPAEMAIRQNEGSNSAPDWSPDGQTLACRSEGGLLIHDLRTNETRKLATKGVGTLNFHYLRWSPDGRRIHGVGIDEKGKWGALYSIDAQTGNSKIIARSDEGGFLFAFDWAPDGKSLYFVRRDDIQRRRRIVRHDIESGAEEEIYSQAKTALYGLAVSPDGKQLAFATDDGLKILATAGGQARDLTRVEANLATAWTKDGKFILYTKLREGSKDMYDLWRIAASGGEPEKLALSMRKMMHVKVHPDGRRIAFTASQRPGKKEVWVMENFLPPGKK
jgi:Tol biopolymer transport system component